MNPPLLSFRALLLALVTLSALTACGGGGSGNIDAQVAPMAVTAAAAVAAPASATGADATTPTPASADEQLAVAMASSVAVDSAALAEVPDKLAQGLGAGAPSKSTNSESSAASLAAAVSTLSLASLPTGAATAGRVFYLDAKTGSDANSGLAAASATAGVGPWRSLAKLATATLLPGDTVRLACGSEWAETLTLGASGNAASPITVAAAAGGCAGNAPTISGGTAIAPGSWQLHSGNIYKTTLAGGALQLVMPGAVLTQAHHPNKGFDATSPASVYLRLATDSNSVPVNGEQASTYLTTGADLKLPIGALIAPGTTVRMRVNSWLIDEGTVSTVSGTRVSLAAPTTYALKAGWGYFLMGQLWMLDSPGEWHYDAAARQLYTWLPDSRPPSATVYATQLATGIDLRSRQYIVIDGLAVKMTGTGINLRGSTGVVVRNSRIDDTAGLGINATGSTAATVATSTFNRTGRDAISGIDYTAPNAVGMQVLDNSITDSGVVMNGETVLSLPVRSYAAIRASGGALVSGNTITNAGYIGIWPLAGSTVRDNAITGACTVQDDCGAIYTSLANNNSTISGNLIRNSRGALAGKAPAWAYTQAQGIYLDESASGVTVSGNTVFNTDHGIHLHVAANNLLKDNKLYGNRVTQIWLQENRNAVNPLGDLFNNTVTGNQIVPTTAAAKGLFLDTQISTTTRFGTFDWNRYFDRIYPIVAVESTPAQRTDYTLAQWKAATALGVPRGLDTNGTGASQTRFASILMNGATIVPNGKMTTSAAGWATWNQTAPYGTLVREACAPGWCGRYTAGGSAGILSSPNFSITAGTWYRLTADLATGVDNQVVNLVVRRGGGGTNGYESLADRSLTLVAKRAWGRYSVIFKATKTINAADPLTLDLGARVDLQNVVPGQMVSVSNLELVPITPADALTRSDLLVNTAKLPTQIACPVASTQPAQCNLYMRLSDNQAVTWPYYLPALGSEIIYTRDARLIDSDGDGIADAQDRCTNTPASSAVNSSGCALGEG